MKNIKGILISFILTIICVLPVFAFCATVNSTAVNVIQDENTFFQKHSFSRVSREKVSGVGGISEDDECIKLIGGDVTGHGNWYTQTEWHGNSDYLVIEFDIMLSDKTENVFLATGGHTPITPTVSVTELCKNDVWGNFVAVFNKIETSSLLNSSKSLITASKLVKSTIILSY